MLQIVLVDSEFTTDDDLLTPTASRCSSISTNDGLTSRGFPHDRQGLASPKSKLAKAVIDQEIDSILGTLGGEALNKDNFTDKYPKLIEQAELSTLFLQSQFPKNA